MADARTAAAVQLGSEELRARSVDADTPQYVRDLLLRSAMIRRSDSRPARPPIDLSADPWLSAVVGRLIQCLRDAHPATDREFPIQGPTHLAALLPDREPRGGSVSAHAVGR